MFLYSAVQLAALWPVYGATCYIPVSSYCAALTAGRITHCCPCARPSVCL